MISHLGVVIIISTYRWKNKRDRVMNLARIHACSFALSVNFRVLTFYKHLLVPSGDNMDRNSMTPASVTSWFSFENGNWDYLNKHGQLSLFLPWSHWWVNGTYFFNFFLSFLIIKESTWKWCSDTINITLYIFYLQLLFLSNSTFIFSLHSWRDERTEVTCVAHLYPCRPLYCRHPNDPRLPSFESTVSLPCTRLPCSTLQSKFCLITTKTTPIKKKPQIHHTGAVTIHLGKHYKGSSFICILLIRSKDLKIKMIRKSMRVKKEKNKQTQNSCHCTSIKNNNFIHLFQWQAKNQVVAQSFEWQENWRTVMATCKIRLFWNGISVRSFRLATTSSIPQTSGPVVEELHTFCVPSAPANPLQSHSSAKLTSWFDFP